MPLKVCTPCPPACKVEFGSDQPLEEAITATTLYDCQDGDLLALRLLDCAKDIMIASCGNEVDAPRMMAYTDFLNGAKAIVDENSPLGVALGEFRFLTPPGLDTWPDPLAQ